MIIWLQMIYKKLKAFFVLTDLSFHVLSKTRAI